ncbi:MAG: DUF4838 domain-containing protein [Lentisphaeria bacterium]|nr:DUF4838 domain-containing protein [Lentisphaeria bacterium]
MKKILFPVLGCIAFLLNGADIEIISGGRSGYKIVYADKELYPFHNRYSSIGAETLQRILRHSTGAVLPIVPESRFDGKGKAIFFGTTDAVRKAGLAPAHYKRWEHRIDVKEGNIYLHGMDWRNKSDITKLYRQRYILGSHKAMLTFLEKFTGAVFAGTPDSRDGVPKIKRLAVPENFSYKRVPAIEYNMAGRRNLDYDIANNSFFAPWYGCYGGHNHNVALNPKKYFKDHPEYYALIKGKRDPGPRVQICLANKDVQELIYKEVLDHIDRGYEMVQLAQSDGFLPCECKECANLFGLNPGVPPTDRNAYRSSPVWGEKLWILHRNFARRLLKDRPGKKVCIMAYGPTRQAPRTFKEFPDNVLIELAPYSEEILKSWAPYTVRGGFVVYLYNWGYYNNEGFMPKRSWNYLKEQAKSLRRSNVKGIYCCGFGEAHGLEGPNYYIWLKLTEDPDQDVAELFKRFCGALFPKAAKEMEEFYTLINSRLDLHYTVKETDWNDPALLTGNPPTYDRAAFGTVLLRWPEEVLVKLDTLLKKAEAKSGKNWQLSLARFELDYLMHTARSVNALSKFRKTLTDADYKEAEKHLVARQKFLNALKWSKNNQTYKNGFALFAHAPKNAVQAGGRMRGLLFAPFNWDMLWLKEKGVKCAGRVIKPGDSVPQYLVPGNYLTEMVPVQKEKAVRILSRVEQDALKVIFIRSSSTYKEMEKSQLSVYLGPDEKNLKRFVCRFRNGRPACYTRKLTNAANKGLGDVYSNGKTCGKVTVPAPGVKLAPGEISAELTIPFSAFEKKPRPGSTWLFNATADHIYPGVSFFMVWEYNFEQASWRNTRDRYGKIVF